MDNDLAVVSGRVLIIDDSASIRDICTTMITTLSTTHKVFECASAEQAGAAAARMQRMAPPRG